MSIKLHPLLHDPNAVFVYRTSVPSEPTWADFSAAAREAMTAMQVELEGAKAVIKPNVTAGEHHANPDSGIGTHPAFVGGMVEYLREHGAWRGGIYVVEDPRDTDDFDPRHWKGTGYLEMAEATGAKLRWPISYQCVKRPVPRPWVHRERNVSRLAVATDAVLINVPKFKTHPWAITTLCLKNLMGLDDVFDRHYCGQSLQELAAELGLADGSDPEEWLDDARHARVQEKIAYRLADLAQVVQPHLNVVEGIVGRDGTGFERGQNHRLGLVVAGVNMVAVDSVSSYLMGFDPGRLIYLQIAVATGLGNNDISQLKVYSIEGGELTRCQDVEALRLRPHFRVIRPIKVDTTSSL
jgi:uncharacterized protein (DUF362 family)